MGVLYDEVASIGPACMGRVPTSRLRARTEHSVSQSMWTHAYIYATAGNDVAHLYLMGTIQPGSSLRLNRGNFTQVCDTHLNRDFKRAYVDIEDQWHALQRANGVAIPSPTRDDMMAWAVMAYEGLDHNKISKGFKHNGLMLNLDGLEEAWGPRAWQAKVISREKWGRPVPGPKSAGCLSFSFFLSL